MDTLQALTTMLKRSGVTPYAAARALGRGSSYVSGMVWRGSCPSADRLAQLAHVCGWRLALLPPDGGAPVVIDGGAGAASSSPD